MKYMRNLMSNVFSFLIIIFLCGCNIGEHDGNSTLILSDTSKAQVIELDSQVIAIVNSDTIKTVSLILEDLDTNSTIKSEDDLFLDSKESVSKIYTNKSKIKLDEKHFMVGRWLVEKRISNGKIKRGEQKVFAVYDNDSSFSMKAINVSGKWWISDTLLFQKFESTSTFSVDTSLIHVLNDSVLEVSDIQESYKFILKKDFE